MLLPCRAGSGAAMRYLLAAEVVVAALPPSTRFLRRSVGEEMIERTIDMRRCKRIGLPALFIAFFWLGVMSFGGGTAGWLYREIVERRHWIDDAEFLSGAALGRLMPGSGGVNLTVQVGQHLRGGPGAITAVLGLLSGPLAIILALTAGYTTIGQSPTLHPVLDGVAAAAIGLTFATGLKLVRFG